ncbi:amino acid permease [Trinickia caryophylli]|uniref:Amino acid exporter, AAE family n=1 Tax=Trinickia caryophylli TaxID=28094 RepID=A0A1X7DDD0_TRICW|nr:amino acid permease [Trinickia caryophylli]PMS09777.1 amino acid permease [Trinickia caryophylli]TRX16841.1 amino acid permease [Trinickia caryophylli]WQE12430.1 amino acid permease [Trinickia caryophylli]SMF13413.1 amino acid exporter, AAE family [Trinickia caryophylli]GLU31421.1 amino acid permease [Trinickia caryophylli]
MSRAAGERAPHGSLTVWQGAALYVGAVLGTGVIALPALAAKVAGPASLVAWFALVVLSAPLAATFAALGARYPDAGGVSTYVRHAFGARASAIVGWCFYFAVPAGAPAAAVFAGAYVADAIGGGSQTVWLTCAALIGAVSAANALGVTVSGRLQVILSSLLVALLVAAVAVSVPHARLEHLRPFAPHGWAAIAPAAALLVWSFAGWEAITHLAGEFRNPARDLPLASGIAVMVVGVLYLAVAGASVLVLGPSAGEAGAPLAQLLVIGIGGQIRIVAALAALLLTLGTMNAYFAGAAKLGAALGRDGALPSWLAAGSRAGDVPRRSLAVIAGLSALATAVVAVANVGPQPLVMLTTGSFVTVYALATAAALRLLPRGSGAYYCALAALVAVIALCVATGWFLLWPLAMSACALLYLQWAKRRSKASDGCDGATPAPAPLAARDLPP